MTDVISPLRDNEYMSLYWPNGYIKFQGAVRIKTDGSFLSAISKAYFMPYKTGLVDGVALDKRAYIERLRNELKLHTDDISITNLSRILEKDIFMLDYRSEDVIVPSDVNRDTVTNVYRGNISIVIIKIGCYYELVGTAQGSPPMIQTIFPADHPLILLIKDRMRQKLISPLSPRQLNELIL